MNDEFKNEQGNLLLSHQKLQLKVHSTIIISCNYNFIFKHIVHGICIILYHVAG